MAKVILTPNEERIVAAVNSGDSIFGITGVDKVTIEAGTHDVKFDQDVEQVVFQKDLTAYSFQQAGNGIKIYDGSTLVSTILIQADGTDLTFKNGTVSVVLDTTGALPVVKLGGVNVTSDSTPATVPVESGNIDTGNSTPEPSVPGQTFTLKEVVIPGTSAVAGTEVVYWGYNPHDHEDPSNSDPTAPSDGGIPVVDLVKFLQDITGLDLKELGLIDDDGIGPFDNVTNLTIGDVTSGDSSQLTITYADGTSMNAEIVLGQEYMAFLNNLIFDASGNSRLYTKLVGDAAATDSSTEPITLTTTENNGGTIEEGFTTQFNDTIVAGRTELLHQAYIDAGAGRDVLEIDAKGVYAQPLQLLNIEEIRIQNLPNVYTNTVDSSSYPNVGTSVATNSIIDLSRATSLEKLVIAEGHDTGTALGLASDLGELTVVGVRNNATTRLEGGFTQDVTVHYGQGVGTAVNLELNIGDTSEGFDLAIAHNASVLNVKSEGYENVFTSGDFGGNLSKMVITGTGTLNIEETLDGFRAGSAIKPAVIDASGMTGGGTVLKFHDQEYVKFVGSNYGDDFASDDSTKVEITGGTSSDVFTAKNGTTVKIDAGNGDNSINADGSETVAITAGTGNDTISVTGDGVKSVTINAGNGSNSIAAGGDAATSVTIETLATSTGSNTIKAQAAQITVTTGAGSDTVTVAGNYTEEGVNFGSLLNIDLKGGLNSVRFGNDLTDAPALGDVKALEGSIITGSNITLYVDKDTDLAQASLTGITKVVVEEGDQLTLTTAQFKALGATKFETHRALTGNQVGDIMIVLAENEKFDLGTVTDLASLNSHVKLNFSLGAGSELTLTAQQLHNYLADDAVDFASENGVVVINNAGQNFTVATDGDADRVFGTINSADVDAVIVNRTPTGFERPADVVDSDVYHVDSVNPPLSTIDTIAPVIQVDGTATVAELTVAHFDTIEEVIGNGHVTRINVELTGDVASDEQGLVTSGVAQYVVTSIDTLYDAATFYLCDESQDVEVLGLQGNAGKTLTYSNVPWGGVHPTFLLEGDGYADFNDGPLKAEGGPDTSNIGELAIQFFEAGAPAVIEINNAGTELGVTSTGSERKFAVDGITLTNALSLTLDVSEGDATIASLSAAGLEDLTVTATEDVVINGVLPASLTAIDASGVAATFTVSMAPGDDFTFVGADGDTNLTITSTFTATADTSIDGGVGGLDLTVSDSQAVVLTDAALENIKTVTLGNGAEISLTFAQFDNIAAADFSTTGAAVINLYGLDSTPFIAPALADGLTIGTLTIAEVASVTLAATTDLTGVAALEVAEGTVITLTGEQFLQLGSDSITGAGTVNITGVTQEDIDNGFDVSAITAEHGTITFAGNVDLDAASDISGFNVVLAAAQELGVATTVQADGLVVDGAAGSSLQMLFSAAVGPIDASGYTVDTLKLLNILVTDQNVDRLFTGLKQSVIKEIYNDLGFVDMVSQVVTIDAGTTVGGYVAFNKVENDVELKEFTLNLQGGVDMGNLILDSGAKDAALQHNHLETLTINSTGTAENILTGETANIIGNIDPTDQGVDSEDNNLLNVEINATQELQAGNVIFSSVVGDDAFTFNDNDSATAVLTVDGTADVTLGVLDTSDTDVDALTVANNGTGTLSVTLNDSDALAFTGANIELTIAAGSTVDLTDANLAAVESITIDGNGALTLTFAQLTALGVANILPDNDDATTGTLNLVGLDGSAPFSVGTLADGIVLATVAVAPGTVVLAPATDLTGVTELLVAEGSTLTLTAAQFQQLQNAGTITGVEGDADVAGTPFILNITGLTQAQVDAGFDLTAVDADATITLTLGEATVNLVGGLTPTNLDDLTRLTIDLTANQTLGLASSTQADGLVVAGDASNTLVYQFDAMDGIDTQIDCSGYTVGILKALATFVSGQNVEDLLFNVPSTVEERYYHDPQDLGFVGATDRVVVVEKEVTVPGFLMYNDLQDNQEVRTLDFTLEGGSRVVGDIDLSTVAKDPGLTTRYFDKLTLNSEGTAADENLMTGDVENVITGSITAAANAGYDTDPLTLGIQGSLENNLLDVEINATQDLIIEGDIVFSSVDANDYPDAMLVVNGSADVTVQQLVVTDAEIDALSITNNGTGLLTVTGASPALDGVDGALETLTLSGSGDIALGDSDPTTTNTGIMAETLSVIDASAMTGDLSLGEVADVDNAAFTFTAGTGVTMMTFTEAGALDSTGLDPVDASDDTAGWVFDYSTAAAGSELHLDTSFAAAVATSKLSIDLGANTTLYIDQTMDLSVLDLSIAQVQDIVLADGATLTLTAAQADTLKIVAGADTGVAGFTGVVNIVGLMSDTATTNNVYDFSDIAAGISGTVTLGEDDVTCDATTDLGAFTVVLDENAATSASLAGQTIRFNTVAQAERAIDVLDADSDGDSSTNVVYLFTTLGAHGPIETANYDAALGRVWVNETLRNGANIEQFFTTLPSTIIRAEFGTLSELNVLLTSVAVDRIMEFASFTTTSALTFSDTGLSPVEHLNSLDLIVGGQATVGNILIDDVIGAPGYDPASVQFIDLTVDSYAALKTGDIYATEGYVNDNDGNNETKADSGLGNSALTGMENALPTDINTVGNIGVGAANGLDLLMVNLDTHTAYVADTGFSQTGAQLDVGTITFGTDNAASTATLNVAGANNITVAAINTVDADITALTIDATGFTAILDPVMHMDSTETLTVQNENDGVTSGTIILEEVEGNELSSIYAANFDGALTMTLSQIDSTNDDLNLDGDVLDLGEEAFTFTAGAGITTVTVAQVGANIPTLNANQNWVFDFSGAAAGSSLTIDNTAVLVAASNLDITLSAGTQLIISDAVDLSAVNFTVVGGEIFVAAGQTLTLSIDQVNALTVDVFGSGTVKIVGDATTTAADLISNDIDGTRIRTVNVDLSALTFDAVTDVDGKIVADFDAFGAGALDDTGADAGYIITGSAFADEVTTYDTNDSFTGGAGNDIHNLYDGNDTYIVNAGSDTLLGLGTDMTVLDAVATGDAVVVSATATATAALIDDYDFTATAATINNGTAIINGAADDDTTIDVSAATGNNGFTITGGTGNLSGLDTLIGSSKADILNGGNLNQSDAAAIDILTGNAGADTFQFDVSVSSAATLTAATTTAGVDVELINVVPDGADGNNESIQVDYTVNGIAGSVLVALGGVDSSDSNALAIAIASGINAQAGISATSNLDVVSVVGDNAASLTITGLAVNGGDVAGFATTATVNGVDTPQVSTLTVTGVPTAGDLYSILAGLVTGGGDGADYTSLDVDVSSDNVAAGLSGAFVSAEINDAVVASVITFTDANADNGGFAITTDTTAAFAGSGASYIGATDYVLADIVTDFVSGTDKIDFGLAAGTGANYAEAAAVADFALARAAANAAFDGTVQYYLTSATDLDGFATTGLVEGNEGAGLLFFDANLDGDVDGVVVVVGISSATFAAADIIA